MGKRDVELTTPVEEPVVVEPEPAAEYVENLWNGRAHFQCALCSFDSFERAAMLEHLVDAHGSIRALEKFVKE